MRSVNVTVTKQKMALKYVEMGGHRKSNMTNETLFKETFPSGISNEFKYFNNTALDYQSFLLCKNKFPELKLTEGSTNSLLTVQYGLKDALLNTKPMKWVVSKNESIRCWADPIYRLERFYEIESNRQTTSETESGIDVQMEILFSRNLK